MAPISAIGTPQLTTETIDELVTKPLQKASVMLSSGVRIIESQGGNPVRIPMLTGLDTPSWHGENEQIDEVDPTFDELILLPHSMKSVKTLTRFSNELARQAVIDVGSALQQRIVADVAGKLDDAFIAGPVSATKETPTGLLNQAGVHTIEDAGAPSLDVLHDAEALLLGSEVDPLALRWLMNSRDFVNLRKLKDSAGRYLVQPDPTQAGAYQLLGHQVLVSNRVPVVGGESSIVLWDPSKAAVVRDMDPTVTVLDQLFGDFDQMAVRVVARYDFGVLNPETVAIVSGVTAPVVDEG